MERIMEEGCRVASAGCVQPISKRADFEKWTEEQYRRGSIPAIIYLHSNNTRQRTTLEQEQEGNNGFCQDFQFGCQGGFFPSVAVRRDSLGILVLVVSRYVTKWV